MGMRNSELGFTKKIHKSGMLNYCQCLCLSQAGLSRSLATIGVRNLSPVDRPNSTYKNRNGIKNSNFSVKHSEYK